MLPDRYNQFIVDNFFKLTHEDDHSNEGIDYQSFVYYDFALRLFYNVNATKRFFLNQAEFSTVLSQQLFPQAIFSELTLIPSTNFTAVSFTKIKYSIFSYLEYLSNVYLHEYFQLPRRARLLTQIRRKKRRIQLKEE
jgi:hypothetical protein